MSHTSQQLQLTLQDLDDNPDSWGDILNVSTLELLEDAVAGMSAVVLTSTADYTMTSTAGGDTADNYRKMIVNITGTPTGAASVLVPDDTSLGVSSTKVYLVYNGTTGGDIITFKTVNGTGIALTANVATWCYCDGTNIVAANTGTSDNSATSTLATDSLALGGVDAALYAQLALQQQYTGGQSTTRVTLTDDANVITPDLADSDTFYALWAGNYTLAAPLNPTDGATFSLVVEQATSGTPPYTIQFAINTFVFPNAVTPSLSVGTSAVDYFAFERVTLGALGARWLASAVKGFG